MQSFLNSLYNAMGAVLAFIYSLIPNLGVAIILLTLVVMLILYPLTAKQAKSMIAMQRVQPEIKKLQAKYKGDRQKLNEEMMKFYQENKINPLAGCLPLVVQLPIFFVLYRVLRTPWQHVPKTGSYTQLYNAMCGQWGSLCGKATTKAMTVTLASGAQKVIPPGGATSHLTHINFLGVDLFKTATDASLGFGSAIPYFVLVGLVVLTGYMQTKQAQSRTPAANKQMNTVMKVLPVFFGLISLSFPAGLVLYFVVSNTWRLGQQEVVFRHLGQEKAGGDKPKLGGAKAAAIDVASTERSPDDGEDGTKGDAPAGDGPAGDGRAGNGRARPTAKQKPGRQPPPKPAAKLPPPQSAGKRSAARGSSLPQRQLIPEERARGGGLRAMFQLPPPPAGNGGTRPSRGPSNGGGSQSAGSPRPTKKKRKR
ncbi:MAG TPA: membrane protein insertase YidC [Acidimicrobiia bacterium]